MTTQFDIQHQLRDSIANDADLMTWLASNFAKPLTIMLGNRKNKTIASAGFPSISIIFEPQEVSNTTTEQNAHLVERYHLDMGIHFAKATKLDDNHLRLMAEMEALVGLAVLRDRRRNGLAINTRVVDRIGDANVNHPYHFFTLVFQVERSAPY